MKDCVCVRYTEGRGRQKITCRKEKMKREKLNGESDIILYYYSLESTSIDPISLILEGSPWILM